MCPSINTVSLKYFQDVAAGTKYILMCTEASAFEVHRFSELNSKAALEMCLQDPLCWQYIPDHWAKPKARVDRQFLWTVLASIRPEYTKAILDNAYNKRWKP